MAEYPKQKEKVTDWAAEKAALFLFTEVYYEQSENHRKQGETHS